MRTGLILLGLAVATSPAAAEKKLKHHTPGVQEDELQHPAEIDGTVASGAVLPWSLGARHERLGVLMSAYGGVDLAKRAPVMIGTLDATLIDRVTLHVTEVNAGMSNTLRPSVGMLFDVARASDYSGVDLAVGADYEMYGYNSVPSVATRAVLGGNIGELRLQANAAFGLGLEKGERYGDLRLSGLHPVAQALYAGLDSRARIDLERDSMEPSSELDWDTQAGPIVQLALGRFAVSATGGVSAWKLRSTETAKVGAVGSLGLGAVF